jgi:hypothetical protein
MFLSWNFIRFLNVKKIYVPELSLSGYGFGGAASTRGGASCACGEFSTGEVISHYQQRSRIINIHQPSTTINIHQPLSTIINNHQQSSSIINPFQRWKSHPALAA